MTDPLDLDAIEREAQTWPEWDWSGVLITKLRQTRKERNRLEELVVNVRCWVAHGCSETAIKALDAAMADGWKEIRK